MPLLYGGPRKTGKSTLLHQQFPHAKWYDLLNTRLKTSLMTDPHRLTEEILAQKPSTVIIDEVQKVPQLLDEVPGVWKTPKQNLFFVVRPHVNLKKEPPIFWEEGPGSTNFFLSQLLNLKIRNFLAFEHFMIEEIRAYLSYREKNLPLSYWRTSNGMEVDLIVGDADLALEFKATSNLKPDHLKGLKTFLEENKAKHAIVICCIPEPRQIDGILALPWKDFCQRLWGDELL